MHKVGDKFLVEIKTCLPDGSYFMRENFSMSNDILDKLPKLPMKIFDEQYVEKQKHQAIEEVMSYVKRIIYLDYDGGFSNKELLEIFNTFSLPNIFEQNSFDEIKAKIETWEKRNVIKAGDVVRVINTDEEGVVLENYNGKIYLYCFNKKEHCLQQVRADILCKTGQTMDVQKILQSNFNLEDDLK